MKFLFTAFVLLASTAVAEMKEGYDSYPSSGLSSVPGLPFLFPAPISLASVGVPIASRLLESIKYSNQFTVFKVEGYTLSANIPSAPNVLLSAKVQPGTSAGNFSKINDDSSFDARAISFACVTKLPFISITTVPCQVRFEGTTTEGLKVNKTVQYYGGVDFLAVDLSFTELQGFDITLSKAGIEGLEVTETSLMFDDFYFNPHPKPWKRDFVA